MGMSGPLNDLVTALPEYFCQAQIDYWNGAPCTVMRRFKSRSRCSLYKMGKLNGQLWQAGYHDRALRREEDLRSVARYVVANPVRAGLVSRVGEYSHWDAIWV